MHTTIKSARYPDCLMLNIERDEHETISLQYRDNWNHDAYDCRYPMQLDLKDIIDRYLQDAETRGASDSTETLTELRGWREQLSPADEEGLDHQWRSWSVEETRKEIIALSDSIPLGDHVNADPTLFDCINWTSTDLSAWLESRDYPSGEENMREMHDMVSPKHLEQYCIESGWEYIDSAVDTSRLAGTDDTDELTSSLTAAGAQHETSVR